MPRRRAKLKRLLQLVTGKRGRVEREEELKELIERGEEEEIISGDEARLLTSIFDLGETPVKEVMIPRVDLVACQVDTPMTEVIRLYLEKGYSRIPVYDEVIDNTVGIIYVRELLKFWGCEGDLKAVEFIRLPYFIPGSKRVLDTMKDFQSKNISIALVVDEYGGVSGAVTMRDLVEEIVGELGDEFRREERQYKALKDGSYIVSTRMNLDELNKVLGTDFLLDDVHTFGGLIYQTQERVPQKGESFRIGSLDIQILEASKQRTRRALVKKRKEEN